jgi:hypothetical protein
MEGMNLPPEVAGCVVQATNGSASATVEYYFLHM